MFTFTILSGTFNLVFPVVYYIPYCVSIDDQTPTSRWSIKNRLL